MKSQKGFSIAPVILLAVIIGIVGVVGWRVMGVQKIASNKTVTPANQTPTVAKEPSSTLQTKKDVEQVQSSLDSANVDGDLDTSGIDSDLNSLL